jgi:hypothetical protein
MPIDWRKEWDLTRRVWKWWLRTGLIAIPFGIVWACTVRVLHYESKLAMVAIVAAALISNYLIQGMPPER